MKPHPSLHTFGLAVAALAISHFTVQAVAQGSGEPSWRRARGRQVIAELGDRLPEVARRYGLSDDGLRQLLERESSIATDGTANLLYACPPPNPPSRIIRSLGGSTPQGAGTASGSGVVSQGPFPAADTFFLHSRPTSSRKIFLDFNGHTTSGTSWNSSYTAGADFTTPPFDIDGSATTSFSTTEIDRIQLIWKRIAEDFSAFDVDVTTEDPGLEALRRSTSTDNAYGIRCVIGGSSYDWFQAGAGGVAYVGSYNWNSDTPCFAFTAQLGSGDEKYTAEASSHEIGHTLGLYHDGQIANGTTAAVEYYQGHANWAPIMGVGYYKAVTQWSKGEYALASNTQDDIAVMQSYGAPLRADDHGNTTVTATTLTGTALSGTGVISTRADADLFKFTTGAGAVSFAVATASPDANVDVQLGLYDGAGSLITSADPTGLASSLSTTLAAGTYYLAVDGVGVGTASSGYTDYASLGQFYLTGNVVASSNQPPVVAAQGTPTTGTAPLTVSFTSSGTYDPDGSISSYNWDFGNGAPQTSTATTSYTYTTPGTYTASLVATDNGGLSASAGVTITVAAPAQTMSISSITVTTSSAGKGTSATAQVTVRSSTGAVVPNATVRGTWSGLVSGNVSALSSSTGIATFTTARVRGTGTFTFTVTGVTANGFTYNAAGNTETSDFATVR